MKRLTLLTMATALLLVGCDPIVNDKDLIGSFDPTEPGLVLFEQSLKAVCAASGGLVDALKLNAYLNAPDEESRLAVEDRYYPYRKVREREDNQWYIFDQSTEEIYYFHEGLTLNEDGAEWTVRSNPTFFGRSTPSPTISKISADKFELSLRGVPISIDLYTPNDLYDYLYWWSAERGGAKLSAELQIATNDTEFRSGKAERLQFVITGEGRLSDTTCDYFVHFEIDEPLHLIFDDVSGMITKNVPCVGTMTIQNSHSSSVDAQMTPYNAIVINYHSKEEGYFVGYYNLLGENISPK